MTSRMQYTRQLDKLVKIAVMERCQGRCFICGRQACDPAHLLEKSVFPSLRFDMDNIQGLCRTCHSSDHTGTGIYLKAWIRRFGQEAYDALRAKGRQTASMTTAEIKDKIKLVKTGAHLLH